MPGLIVTLQGNSSGYEAMLAKSVAQAKTAGGQIAVSLQKQISVLEKAAAGATPGSANSIAIASRLKAARLELAKDEAIQRLAIQRAAGVQLSLAEAMRLKEAGLEYRSLGVVAAETEAWKVQANKTAMEKIIQQEREEATAEVAMQEERIAAEKLADDVIVATRRNQARALWRIRAEQRLTKAIDKEQVATGGIYWWTGQGKRDAAASATAERIAATERVAALTSTANAAGLVAKQMTLAGHSAANFRAGVGELVVIAREFTRGNYSRMFSSATIAAQRFGASLVTALLSIPGIIVTLGLVISYLINRHYKELFTEIDNTNKLLDEHKGKFEKAAEAIKQHADAMRAAAKEAADFNDWLQRLAVSTETLSTLSDEHIAAMQAEFALIQQLDSGHVSKRKELADEQAERQKELDEYNSDLKQANTDESASLAAVTDAQKKYNDSIQKGKESNDAFSELQEQAKKLDDVYEKIDDKTKARMAILRGQLAGTIPFENEDAARRQDSPKGLAEFLKESRGMAQSEMDSLYQQNFGGLQVGDKKFNASEAQLDYMFTEKASRAALVNRDETELEATNEQLKKALDDAKTKHEDNSKTVQELTKKQKELSDVIALHAKYDPKLAAEGKGGGGRMEVTDRERIGLGAASSVQVSMLDFTRKIEQHGRESKAILDYIKTHLQGNDGAFE